MSKKKVTSRSVMTLKDFHGGSIPSDLPLPSAPGMTVDRSVFERQGSGTWMSPTLGRGGYNSDRSGYHRQGSSLGVRAFDDKASYFPNPANIGRNYDEDERKPVDSRPRSSHSADRFDDHSYEERRGGYSVDRYSLEDQSTFSETRGSCALDRFPPSQVTGGGFETNVYVHDEFGLIPVGPRLSRMLPQEIPFRSQPASYQREMVAETRPVQSSYVQIQQQNSAPPPHSPNQHVAASPPRSWKNPSHQVQQTSASAASPQLPTETATNVWTAKRDGEDLNRTPEMTSDSQGSSTPWRPQSVIGRAVDKVPLGRLQPDASRLSPGRWQADSTRESIHHKLSGAEELSAGYAAFGADNTLQSHGEDFSDRRFLGREPDRGNYSETGRVPYLESRSVDDGRQDLTYQSKAGYRDVSRVGGVGGTSSNGRFLSYESVAQSELDRSKDSEGGDGSMTAATVASRESSQSEITERPKLKLLPRSKPLEKIEPPSAESGNALGYEEGSRKLHGLSDNRQQATDVSYLEGVVPKRELGTANDETNEDGSRRVERPKLNLKPRSQPQEAEPAEGSQTVRQSVFGGARPRELVLKERGVDDVLNGAVEGALTPSTASTTLSASFVARTQYVKTERPDTRADGKGNIRLSERSYERQQRHHTDRLESRVDSVLDCKWDLEKESQWDQERPDVLRREFERQDSRRDSDSRDRDIDKRESWQRPVESTVSIIGVKSSSSPPSSLVDPSPRGSGRSGYSSTVSAVELAQAFSRSSSIGSTMTGAAWASNSVRTPLSPIPRGSVQGFAPGYVNGTVSRDAPFSRLAEASPPPVIGNSEDMYLQGGGFGQDSQRGYFGNGKLSGYAPTDLKRGPSFGRTQTNPDFMEENGDFPGKRGLPMRQRDGYFD